MFPPVFDNYYPLQRHFPGGVLAAYSRGVSGHDPYAYLKDVLERLPTQPASGNGRPTSGGVNRQLYGFDFSTG